MFEGRIRSWRRALHKWDDPLDEPIQQPQTEPASPATEPQEFTSEVNDEVAELLRGGVSNSKLLDSILTGKDVDSDDDVL